MNCKAILVLVFNFFVCNGAAVDKVTFSEPQTIRGKKVITVSVQNFYICNPLKFENTPLFYKYLKNNRFLVASENEIKICAALKPTKNCKLNYYIRDIIELANGKLVILCDKSVALLDADLKPIREITYDGEGWISFAYELCDERLLVINEIGNNKFEIYVECLKDKKFVPFYKFPEQEVKDFGIDKLKIKITPENGNPYIVNIGEETLEDLLQHLLLAYASSK